MIRDGALFIFILSGINTILIKEIRVIILSLSYLPWGFIITLLGLCVTCQQKIINLTKLLALCFFFCFSTWVKQLRCSLAMSEPEIIIKNSSCSGFYNTITFGSLITSLK